MPLYMQKLSDELARKRERFTGYSDRFDQQLAAYRAALDRLGERYADAASLERALTNVQRNGGQISLGALPTGEYDAWLARAARAGCPCCPSAQLRASRRGAGLGRAHPRLDDAGGGRQPTAALARRLVAGGAGAGGHLRESPRSARAVPERSGHRAVAARRSRRRRGRGAPTRAPARRSATRRRSSISSASSWRRAR